MLEGFILIIAAWLLAFAVKYWQSFQKFKNDKNLHQLASMNRRDFEIYISKTLKRKGWKKVKVGTGSQDGGYDVSGFINWKHCIVQCKCYKIGASIGVKTVRELYGVARSKNATALFVATCRFTKAAKSFARKNNIEIWDKENIVFKTSTPNSQKTDFLNR